MLFSKQLIDWKHFKRQLHLMGRSWGATVGKENLHVEGTIVNSMLFVLFKSLKLVISFKFRILMVFQVLLIRRHIGAWDWKIYVSCAFVNAPLGILIVWKYSILDHNSKRDMH